MRLVALLSVLALVGVAGCGSTSKGEAETAEKLYADARDDLESGNFDKAIKTLEKIEGRASGTLMAQQAMLDMAYAQWRANERVQAVATLDRFAKLYPSSPAMDYAMYLKGVVNFNDNLGFLASLSRQSISERDQRAMRDSFESFKRLVEQYPESKYSVDARVRMDYIVNSLAEYEVHVARYYYRRGAYLAAANRAQHAVRDFAQAPAVEEALYIMALCYDRLGLTQLRDDADRVLKANYPSSRYLSQGIRVTERAWWRLW
jgi:outer membrane protein assembly factor BamD